MELTMKWIQALSPASRSRASISTWDGSMISAETGVRAQKIRSWLRSSLEALCLENECENTTS